MIDLLLPINISQQYHSTHGLASVCAQAIVLHFLKFLFFTYFLYQTHMLCLTLCPSSSLFNSPHYALAFLFFLFFSSQTCVRPAILFLIMIYRQLLLSLKHHQQINQLYFFFACQIDSFLLLLLLLLHSWCNLLMRWTGLLYIGCSRHY